MVSAAIKREPLREKASLKTSDHNQADKMFTDLKSNPPVPALSPASVRCLMLGRHFFGFHKRLSDKQEMFPPSPEWRLPGAVASLSRSDHTD